jgi:peptidoglycan/LPS O-acetylase OafA/YrhL
MPLIYRAAEGFTGIPGILLTRRPLLYIGKISYGIYIYHLPVHWLIYFYGSNWLNRLPWAIPRAAVYLTATVIVAPSPGISLNAQSIG